MIFITCLVDKILAGKPLSSQHPFQTSRLRWRTYAPRGSNFSAPFNILPLSGPVSLEKSGPSNWIKTKKSDN
jgi:hypothetical protein